MSDHEDGSDTEKKEVELDCRAPEVVTKYKTASEIAVEALNLALSLLKPGAKIVDICHEVDTLILTKTAAIYNKKGKGGDKIEKGIAFPTCVSVNNVCGHFSPMKDHTAELKAGDLVKVDLGVHVDGYPALVAHTKLVEGDAPVAVDKKLANLLHATNVAMEAAIRKVKIGSTNLGVTEVIKKVAEIYGVNPLQAVLSHNMSRFVIDGDKVIISKADAETKVEEVKFEEYEVYALDIVMSTGEGKPREVDERATVYKRIPDARYSLKMKASRDVFKEISDKFSVLPFTLRLFEDEKKGKLGIVECCKHGLVQDYPVLIEKDGEFVAQLKSTIILLPTGTLKITGTPLDLEKVKTDVVLEDEEIKSLLSAPLKKKKKNKKKKKTDGGAATAEDDKDEE